MRVHTLLNESITELTSLVQQCSQFLEEAGVNPLFKNLPRQYSDFHKVKVRKKKSKGVDDIFNEAFDYHALRQRAVIANGIHSFLSEGIGLDPFYVFPIDGYKFIYSEQVQDSSAEYEDVFDSIVEGFGQAKGNEVITEMLQFTYTNENLSDGIERGSEIILYNIPYYYAVRADIDYDELLTDLAEL